MAAGAPPAAQGWGIGSWLQSRSASDEPVTKVGAGLLLRDSASGDCLLLLRRSLHNDNTWGLPGGNADPDDGAARRCAACGANCAASLWF
jgi:hypothetical protein